jgi:hypothetical protein
MTCDEALGRLELLRDGALPADEAASVHEHLAACASCRRLEAQGAALGSAVAALATGVGREPGGDRRAPRGPARRVRAALAGASLAVALAAALAAVARWREVRRSDEALAAIERIIDRKLASGICPKDLGSQTCEVTVGGRRAVVELEIKGGPGLYEVRAIVKEMGDAGRDVEVAALCGAHGRAREAAETVKERP